MSERFILIVEPIPQGPPPMQKLKLLAKSMLRRFGLRIVDIREQVAEPAPEPQPRRQLPLSIARGGETPLGRHGERRSASRTPFGYGSGAGRVSVAASRPGVDLGDSWRY